jgi:hypothetical protein
MGAGGCGDRPGTTRVVVRVMGTKLSTVRTDGGECALRGKGGAVSPRSRRRGVTRQGPVVAVPPNGDPACGAPSPEVQRAWWAIGIAAGFVATLGFQTFPPSRRLDAIEAANARQDSVFAAEAAVQREALESIRRQLGQLLAGQCAMEKDGMARVLYGCGGDGERSVWEAGVRGARGRACPPAHCHWRARRRTLAQCRCWSYRPSPGAFRRSPQPTNPETSAPASAGLALRSRACPRGASNRVSNRYVSDNAPQHVSAGEAAPAIVQRRRHRCGQTNPVRGAKIGARALLRGRWDTASGCTDDRRNA